MPSDASGFAEPVRVTREPVTSEMIEAMRAEWPGRPVQIAPYQNPVKKPEPVRDFYPTPAPAPESMPTPDPKPAPTPKPAAQLTTSADVIRVVNGAGLTAPAGSPLFWHRHEYRRELTTLMQRTGLRIEGLKRRIADLEAKLQGAR